MITQIDVNGKTMFVHTAWSDDPEGGGMVTTEPEDADYIGTCTDSSSEEVTDPARYTWRYADINANLDDSDDEFEEDEEDDDGALDDGMEDVESSLQEVAGRIDTQGMDMVNTTNVTDSAIGNANELEGTNKGETGWTVPDGFTLAEQSEDVDGNPDTDPVLTTVITRTATGTDSVIRFDAGTLVQALADTEKENAYTMSLQSKMTSLFDVPVSLADPDGSNVMLDFGSISNALIDAPEDPEEEDAGEQDAADGNPTIEDIIEDEELAEEEPTGETTGEDAWTWFESTAESTGAAVSSQVLRFDLSAMPVGATLAIADLKIEPGAMATPWRRSIIEVDEAAETAQSTADTAKKDAATAQSGVDTLNTYIRRRDDGVEVARKDADGNYVGFKTIQTADGVEVRTADDVLIARYGDYIQLTNGTAEGFRVEFGNTLVPIKEKFSDISNINEDEDNITISDDGSTWAKSYTTKWGADQATGVKASGHIYAAYASVGNFKEATMNFDLADGESKAVKFNDGVQAAKVTITVAYTSTGNATVTLSIDPGADIITLSNFSIAYSSSREDVCMGTLGTHPDTSTPAVFRVGNGTEKEPSNAFAVDWHGNVIAGANMYADSIALGGSNISSIFSGVISIGYENKNLSIAAGGNTGDSTISLSKDGYSARCICGWNMSGTGASNCTISKLFINQTDQQLHYYVKNTGSSKATPTIRTYILYTKSDLPQLQ